MALPVVLVGKAIKKQQRFDSQQFQRIIKLKDFSFMMVTIIRLI